MMPSERALRAAMAINITITEDALGHRNDFITSDDIADIISSEYADLEAYVEYVEGKIEELSRMGFNEIMPSTFPEWSKGNDAR